MESAAELTEKFHSHSPVLSLVNLQELFTSYHLADGDWRGLAEQIFTSIFSQEFLQPLEATDTRFELKVQHVDLNDYMEQLITAKHSEDLERVERLVTKAPKLENSIIPKPIFLEIFSCEFSPRSSYTNRSQFSSEAPGYMAHPGLVMATIAGKRQLHGVTLEWLKEPNNRAFVVELIKIKRPQVNVNVVNVEDIVIDETLQI